MRKFKPFLVLFVLILAVTLLVFFVAREPAPTVPEDSIAAINQGLEYLKSLEAKDPTAVEATLKEFRRQELLAQREARMQELENGEISIWSLFEDYMLMGDSRVMGFEFYEYLDKERVLAEKGDTILTLKEHIPEIVSMNPSYLFISYGINDVGNETWTPQTYAEDFSKIIQDIQAQIPGIKIFVNSILPARDPAFNTSAAWRNIPEFNTALQDMCAQNGIFYVDNDAIAQRYADLYESDGIHVKAAFYSHWAANMIMSIYDSEVASESDLAA